MSTTVARPEPAHYDDNGLNYVEYWTSRTYEHHAEVMAVRRLLDGYSFEHAVDIGGGYGRLSVVLADYARKVTLVDPSRQQLGLAASFLEAQPRISAKLMNAADLQFADGSADLVAMVRVLHHLPDPTRELAELYRILRPGGYALIEVANVAHAVNRVRYLVKRMPIPMTPVDIRTEGVRQLGGIPFVNHHPATIIGQLEATGLHLERKLSVSNLRHRLATRTLPRPVLLQLERAAQKPLAPAYFGPSMFLLLRK